ncbi:MAG: DUF4097 family beta strand repeat protein [Clostridiales bacterium]|nr:DUF4097 family beta strand repeat protein [Clostridiales bacterium]
MKTFTKVALITAGITLSAGIALSVVGIIANKGKTIHMYYDKGFHLDSEGHIHEQKKMVVDDFSNVSIDVGAADVKFIESNEYAIEYKLEAKEVTAESKDDTLTITSHKHKFSVNFSWFNFNDNDYFVYVYYPKGADFKDVLIDTSAGDVIIDNGFDCDKISFDLSAGDVKINNVNGALTVDMSAGDFEAKNCKFGVVDFDLSAGDVDLDKCTVAGGKVDMSAGDFDAKALTLTASLEVDMSAGDCTIEFVDGQKIGYEIDISAGSCRINGEKRGDEFTMKDGYDVVLTADLSAGSVEITNK